MQLQASTVDAPPSAEIIEAERPVATVSQVSQLTVALDAREYQLTSSPALVTEVHKSHAAIQHAHACLLLMIMYSLL